MKTSNRVFGRLAAGFIAIFIITTVGTAGYVFIEGWTVFDALYMTVITLSTVGFGEIRELSPQGRIFTVTLITFGFGVAGYFTGTLASFIVEGELKSVLKGQRMDRVISKLKN